MMDAPSQDKKIPVKRDIISCLTPFICRADICRDVSVLVPETLNSVVEGESGSGSLCEIYTLLLALSSLFVGIGQSMRKYRV